MSTIFSANHNAGNFSEYTTSTTDGGDLSISASAALGGTAYGMACLLDDTNAIYAYKVLSATDTSTVFEGRFYIDPNTLSINDGGQVSVFYLINSTTTQTFVVYKLMNIGGSYVIRGVLINDAGTHNETSAFTISDAPHFIEFKATKSTNSTSNNATLDTWVDGSAQTQLSGIDCYDRFNTYIIVLGAPSQSGTLSGTFYLDELVVNNDGGYIGPLGASATASITEAAQTISASGTTTISATGSKTESADTISASATVPLAGSLSKTESNDTISATASSISTATGAASITDGADSISASAALAIYGTSTNIEGSDTISASAVGLVSVSASLTESGDTLSSSVSASIYSTSGTTEGSDTVTSAGTVPVAATGGNTESNDSLNASGVIGYTLITGSASITESADTLSSSVVMPVYSTSSITENADTISASVSTSYPAATATAGITESSDTVTASTSAYIYGTSTNTENADTISAAGIVGYEVKTATASITESADAITAAAVVYVYPTAGINESSDTILAACTASNLITAGLVDMDTVSASGGVYVSASASISEIADAILGNVKTVAYEPTAMLFTVEHESIHAGNRQTIQPTQTVIKAGSRKA